MKLQLSNDSAQPFYGWLRTNVDILPTFRGGGHESANWMLGTKSGADTWNLDVFTVLQPGERKIIDLNEGSEALRNIPPIADDPNFLGGIPVSICGVPMERLSCVVNGAGYDVHYRAKVGRTLNVDLWVKTWPEQPAWCPFEVGIDASDPTVQDVAENIPQELRLRFGDAEVLIPGLPDNAPMMQVNDWLADAQPRLLAGVLYWDRHDTGWELANARAYADQLVQCNGLAKLYHHGNVGAPAGFDGKAWTKAMLPDVIRVSHNWDISPMDPNVVSQTTGAQGAQAFTLIEDPSMIGPVYLAGLDVSYPMCPLEADGSQLDYKAHEGLRMSDGRVNRQLPSRDNLGKNNEPSSYDCHGYKGPGYEWYFDFTAWAAARLKGTPATQWVLQAHARLLMFTLPTASTPDNWLPPNRGVGWWAFTVAELYRGLKDRELAEALKARFIETFTSLILPRMGTADGWWSWRDDALGGTPQNPVAIVWQCSVLSLGLRWAGDALSHDGMIHLATSIAEDYIARAWFHDDTGHWHVRDLIAKDGTPLPYVDAYYPHFGVPHGIAAMLLWNRNHGVAGAIRRQIEADCTTWNKASWLAPLPQAVTP